MSGLEFHMEFDTGHAELRLDRLASLDKGELLESLGQLGEQQTKRRISSEKESPDGKAWPEWSAHYAGSRHGGNSLLMGDGGLLDSIAAGAPSGDEIAWGSNVVYAAVHNFGHTFSDAWGKGIKAEVPQRQYLGLSDDNKREMEMVAHDFLREVMQ